MESNGISYGWTEIDSGCLCERADCRNDRTVSFPGQYCDEHSAEVIRLAWG